MAYEVTATRRRPQVFDHLIGQDFFVSTLKNSIRSKRIAHAYLFSGPRGVGKTSAARILAKALNCESGPTDTPCGECQSCQEIQKGSALDVIEIDGASNTSVNDIREIKDEVLFAPNNNRYKIYIIDEVHMLSNSAFNALLKTIEEPPPYIIFIFATTEIHKVPATIRSRCQQYNFRLIALQDIKRLLTEACSETNIQAEDEALFWIAKEATGSQRDAYTLFDQVVAFSDGNITIEKIKEKLGLVGIDQMNLLADMMIENDTQALLENTHEILQRGVSVEQFVIDLTEFFRSILFLKNNIHKESLLGYQANRFSEKAVQGLEIPQIELAIDLLTRLFRDLRYSINQRFELELVLSRLGHLNQYLSTNQLYQKIKGLKQHLENGAFVIHSTSSTDEEKKKLEPEPEPEPVIEITPEILKETVLSRLGNKKLALISALQKSNGWNNDNNQIIIEFDSSFLAKCVESDLPVVSEAVKTVLERPIEVKIRVLESEEQIDEESDNTIHLVKTVFRGDIVQGEE